MDSGWRGPAPHLGLSDQERDRIDRISEELREGIESLSGIGPAVSVFGSARSRAQKAGSSRRYFELRTDQCCGRPLLNST